MWCIDSLTTETDLLKMQLRAHSLIFQFPEKEPEGCWQRLFANGSLCRWLISILLTMDMWIYVNCVCMVYNAWYAQLIRNGIIMLVCFVLILSWLLNILEKGLCVCACVCVWICVMCVCVQDTCVSTVCASKMCVCVTFTCIQDWCAT